MYFGIIERFFFRHIEYKQMKHCIAFNKVLFISMTQLQLQLPVLYWNVSDPVTCPFFQGDVAETVRLYFEESKRLPPQKKSLLSLQQVALIYWEAGFTSFEICCEWIFWFMNNYIVQHKLLMLWSCKVDDYLDELSKVTKEDDQQRILTKVAKRLVCQDRSNILYM